ncbi:hypothetical protein CANMA_001886 [Candida margitis]|uniref:uncharacterized protein n=1 Tax=Candida margitis TaxID=1775924 RepID=UPI0022271F36|nr:uncharacterized protein CANMA_001886 [Candida margitis]KAI5969081.1 hypothetical protein CANMA_001886 [Candida margitis]
MLRSQSISDINEKKTSSTSKLFNAFKRSSNSNSTASTDIQEKRKSRPLSSSISALNLKISAPVLQESTSTTKNPSYLSNPDNKENINHHHQQQQQQSAKLKTRSSTPNLNRRSSVYFSGPDSKPTAATARMLRTNNRYSFIAGNNFQAHSSKDLTSEDSHTGHSITNNTASSSAHISPATISSQSDSIFDQSSISCVGDDDDIDSEAGGTGASSEISSIHTAETSNEANYVYAKHNTTATAKTKTKSTSTASSTIPESPSSSIISTSIPKKLHRTTNLYNLNEFINKLSIDANTLPASSPSASSSTSIQQPSTEMISMSNRKSIEFENHQIKQLNNKLNSIGHLYSHKQAPAEASYHCQIKLVENVLFLTTHTDQEDVQPNGQNNTNRCSFDYDLKLDEYLDVLKNEEYNLDASSMDSNIFESDGDQLYLMY